MNEHGEKIAQVMHELHEIIFEKFNENDLEINHLVVMFDVAIDNKIGMGMYGHPPTMSDQELIDFVAKCSMPAVARIMASSDQGPIMN